MTCWCWDTWVVERGREGQSDNKRERERGEMRERLPSSPEENQFERHGSYCLVWELPQLSFHFILITDPKKWSHHPSWVCQICSWELESVCRGLVIVTRHSGCPVILSIILGPVLRSLQLVSSGKSGLVLVAYNLGSLMKRWIQSQTWWSRAHVASMWGWALPANMKQKEKGLDWSYWLIDHVNHGWNQKRISTERAEGREHKWAAGGIQEKEQRLQGGRNKNLNAQRESRTMVSMKPRE